MCAKVNKNNVRILKKNVRILSKTKMSIGKNTKAKGKKRLISKNAIKKCVGECNNSNNGAPTLRRSLRIKMAKLLAEDKLAKSEQLQKLEIVEETAKKATKTARSVKSSKKKPAAKGIAMRQTKRVYKKRIQKCIKNVPKKIQKEIPASENPAFVQTISIDDNSVIKPEIAALIMDASFLDVADLLERLPIPNSNATVTTTNITADAIIASTSDEMLSDNYGNMYHSYMESINTNINSNIIRTPIIANTFETMDRINGLNRMDRIPLSLNSPAVLKAAETEAAKAAKLMFLSRQSSPSREKSWTSFTLKYEYLLKNETYDMPFFTRQDRLKQKLLDNNYAADIIIDDFDYSYLDKDLIECIGNRTSSDLLKLINAFQGHDYNGSNNFINMESLLEWRIKFGDFA